MSLERCDNEASLGESDPQRLKVVCDGSDELLCRNIELRLLTPLELYPKLLEQTA